MASGQHVDLALAGAESCLEQSTLGELELNKCAYCIAFLIIRNCTAFAEAQS
jgi:hypothetical protein